MSSTSTTDLNALNIKIQYYNFITERYHLYSDARTNLGPYRVIFKEGFEPEYPEFDYDGCLGNVNYEEFTKCVKIVHECLMLFPFLKADY